MTLPILFLGISELSVWKYLAQYLMHTQGCQILLLPSTNKEESTNIGFHPSGNIRIHIQRLPKCIVKSNVCFKQFLLKKILKLFANIEFGIYSPIQQPWGQLSI